MVKKRILISPLNWGLGHATRCIPIIKALEANNFEPILASDGDALGLLKKNFHTYWLWNYLRMLLNTRKKAKILNGNYFYSYLKWLQQ